MADKSWHVLAHERHGKCGCCTGTVAPLLQDVSMQLPANSMGLIYGRSGAVSCC